MKNFLRCIFILTTVFANAQEASVPFSVEANFIYGFIPEHNKAISHLITGHPTGVILGYNKKTFGKEAWEKRFNYPDYGATFIYQDFKNEALGDNFSLLAHYNFYFFKRNLMVRMAQGISYNTNPYDKEKNFRNNAFGTHLLSTSCLMVNYKKENLFDGFGVQAGLSLTHYSNGSFKSPNASVNTMCFNVGVNYVFDAENLPKYTIDKAEDTLVEARNVEKDSIKFIDNLKYNIAFRVGVNESNVVNSKQYASYTLSGYVDKQLSDISAIQLGTDVFFSQFLKSYIKYKSVAFPQENTSGDEDYKRVGLFVGHELFFRKTSLLTQLGYYVYYPFDYEGRIYNRTGLKRYFKENLFGTLSLKSHMFKAETFEFAVGYRF